APPLLPAVAYTQATVLFSVPTLYALLLRQPDFDACCLTTLRLAVSAAERLPKAVAEEWRARTGVAMLDGLGSTELTHVFISARPGDRVRGSLGTPVRGYEARV